jgi:GNAT superfamily N-acetyltransferase
MVTETVTPPARMLPDVETRRIDDEASRQGLSDLNAVAYNVSHDWVRDIGMSESLWKDPLYGYNAYVDDQPVATAIVLPQNGVLYVAWVATAAAYRRRGLADLVMRRSLEHATRETGITRTALHATADGYPGYLKMGYRPVEEFALYGPV